MNRIVWFVSILILWAGCALTSHGEDITSVSFRAVPNPVLWGVGDKPLYLVITEKNWSSYYSNPPKDADFVSSVYLVASLGLKPNPGYTVKILQLRREGDNLTVTVELGEPDPTKFYVQIMVKPTAVVEVPKAKLHPRNSLTFVFTDQNAKKLATVRTPF